MAKQKSRRVSRKVGTIIFEVSRYRDGYAGLACVRAKPGNVGERGWAKMCGHSGAVRALKTPTDAVRLALVDLTQRIRRTRRKAR